MPRATIAVQGNRAKLRPQAAGGSTAPQREPRPAPFRSVHMSHSALTFVSESCVSLSPRRLSSAVPPPSPPSRLRGAVDTECSAWAPRNMCRQVPSDRGISGVVARLVWAPVRVSASRRAEPSVSSLSERRLPDHRPHGLVRLIGRTDALSLRFARCTFCGFSPAVALCVSSLRCPCAAHFPDGGVFVLLLICESSLIVKEASPTFFGLAEVFCCHSDLFMVFFCIK